MQAWLVGGRAIVEGLQDYPPQLPLVLSGLVRGTGPRLAVPAPVRQWVPLLPNRTRSWPRGGRIDQRPVGVDHLAELGSSFPVFCCRGGRGRRGCGIPS
jgi:hypothetical protein